MTTSSTKTNLSIKFSANTLPFSQLTSIKGAERPTMIVGWDQEEL